MTDTTSAAAPRRPPGPPAPREGGQGGRPDRRGSAPRPAPGSPGPGPRTSRATSPSPATRAASSGRPFLAGLLTRAVRPGRVPRFGGCAGSTRPAANAGVPAALRRRALPPPWYTLIAIARRTGAVWPTSTPAPGWSGSPASWPSSAPSDCPGRAGVRLARQAPAKAHPPAAHLQGPRPRARGNAACRSPSSTRSSWWSSRSGLALFTYGIDTSYGELFHRLPADNRDLRAVDAQLLRSDGPLERSSTNRHRAWTIVLAFLAAAGLSRSPRTTTHDANVGVNILIFGTVALGLNIVVGLTGPPRPGLRGLPRRRPPTPPPLVLRLAVLADPRHQLSRSGPPPSPAPAASLVFGVLIRRAPRCGCAATTWRSSPSASERSSGSPCRTWTAPRARTSPTAPTASRRSRT